jgi:uncharacterized protein HemX
MRNNFFHFAISTIASLGAIGTITFVAFTSPAAAIPGIEGAKTTTVTPNPPTATNTSSLACSNTKPREITIIAAEGITVTLLLVGLGLGAIGYRRYKQQRNLSLQEQIQLLEKIWKMTPQR